MEEKRFEGVPSPNDIGAAKTGREARRAQKSFEEDSENYKKFLKENQESDLIQEIGQAEGDIDAINRVVGIMSADNRGIQLDQDVVRDNKTGHTQHNTEKFAGSDPENVSGTYRQEPAEPAYDENEIEL